MGIVLVPMLAFSVAVAIDLTAWTFTGHELFPWIGKALNG